MLAHITNKTQHRLLSIQERITEVKRMRTHTISSNPMHTRAEYIELINITCYRFNTVIHLLHIYDSLLHRIRWRHAFSWCASTELYWTLAFLFTFHYLLSVYTVDGFYDFNEQERSIYVHWYISRKRVSQFRPAVSLLQSTTLHTGRFLYVIVSVVGIQRNWHH